MTGERIVFGGGCFWCTDAVFKLLRGVEKTMPGYAGGAKENPTYDEVCTGRTGHAEVLRVDYDSAVIPLDTLLDVFFEMHDPTSLNRQGADMGSQYRSIILYETEEQRTVVEAHIEGIRKNYAKPIVTEVKRLDVFYPAEAYHMDYYAKNRMNPYCALVISPKVSKIKKEFARMVR